MIKLIGLIIAGISLSTFAQSAAMNIDLSSFTSRCNLAHPLVYSWQSHQLA